MTNDTDYYISPLRMSRSRVFLIVASLAQQGYDIGCPTATTLRDWDNRHTVWAMHALTTILSVGG